MRKTPSCRKALQLTLLLTGLTACRRPAVPGDPLPGLTAAQRAQFDSGRVVFDSVFSPEKGLGPQFNAEACGECHEDPAPGGTGDEVERHAAVFRADAPPSDRPCNELVDKGGPVFQQRVTALLRAAIALDSEPIPPEATVIAKRTSPDVLGFGLLDAVPDSAILALADPDDENHDGISGRPNRFFDGRLGRFGRKALVPTLREFNAGAFVIEQGVTNPASIDEGTVGGRPLPAGTDPAPEPELSAAAVELADVFVRLLAPPAPQKHSREGRRGRDVFNEAGCAGCHVPVLRTGDHPIAALSRRDVAAYTDLLLHDMGTELADICFGNATPSEFRTEPLMGVRLVRRLLHDGRAATLEEAIEQHGGEAVGSRDRFRALSDADRAALIAFLKTL